MSLIDLPADGDCLLYLIRHGATPPNLVDPPVMQGAGIDEPLAEIGRRQAARAAAALSGRPLRAVYSSPLLRATETAQVIADKHGLAVTPVDAVKEVEVGRWEGSNWADVEKNDPENYAAFRRDPGSHGYPGGESLQDLLDRVAPTLEELMNRHAGEEIAVVAHSVVNRVYMGSLLGVSFAEGYWLPQANCGINVVRYRKGAAKLVSFNSVAHLL
ncbi:histidine phosphatase family protein [Botrimarina sp.]|uniref:histidine phosphatase family protein n=1 Tax=Botrimarina sp. TaxID=2795802 RepID=UPI0032EF4F1B